MKSLSLYLCFLIAIPIAVVMPQQKLNSHFTIARLKYSGGGDWYNDPSMIPNLLHYLGEQSTILPADDEVKVSLLDENLYAHPVLFMTGHGRITFTEREAEQLRNYLLGGGFLYADDDYGMDEFFRKEMTKVFPDKKFVELPFSHPLFSTHFLFLNGLPKIHEHDGGAPKGFALFHESRMIVFYSFNTNISDGWADPDVHGDPPAIREQALQMGSNIIIYALTQ